MMTPHSLNESGVTRNISPPKVTMPHCPTSTSSMTSSRVRSDSNWWKAEWSDPSALALSRFHHCNITKVVKKRVSS